MIRPLTCTAMLIAAGSGLYLYQAKHQGFVLDRQIASVLADTGKLRQHIAVLQAEYALLNDPSRLQQLASAHLPGLAPMAPGQFTTLADLDARLPPVGPPPAPPQAPATPDAAAAPGGAGVQTGSVPYDFPRPPKPAELPQAAPSARDLVASAAPAPAAVPGPGHADAAARAAPAAKPQHPRPPVYASVIRPQARRVAAYAPVRPRPDPLAIQAASPVFTNPAQVASALGMARTIAAPAAVSYQRYQAGAAELTGR